MTEVIHLSLDADGIATICMDRLGGNMNTIDGTFMAEFSAAIERIARDDTIRGAILTSGKAAFLAGADLKDMVVNLGRISQQPHQEIFDLVWPLSESFRRMETCGKPVACAINGVALGGGTEIALACHYRVLADDPAIVMGLPEVQIGLLPAAGGTQRVPRLIGLEKGLPMLIEGNPIAPAQALAMGLVDRLVPPDQVMAEAKRWLLEVGEHRQPWDKPGFALPLPAGDATAAQLCQAAVESASRNPDYPAPLAIARAVQDGFTLPLDAALPVEIEHMVGLMQSPVSRNIIRTQFLSKGRANRLLKRPAGIAKTVFRQVAVGGASDLAASLAQRCAKLARVQAMDGKATDEPDAALLALADDGPVDAAAPLPQAPLLAYVSNSHSGEAAALAQPLPPNALQLLFAGTPEQSQLVEVLRSPATSPAAIARALDLARGLRQTPIVVSSPGSGAAPGLVRRLRRAARPQAQQAVAAQVLEAVACLAEGVVEDAADADLGAVLGAGFPSHLGGPFALLDTRGINAFVQECERLPLAPSATTSASLQLLRRLAAAGHRFYSEEGHPNPLPA